MSDIRAAPSRVKKQSQQARFAHFAKPSAQRPEFERMSIVQPKPDNPEQLRDKLVECLAAIKRHLEDLRDCPDANGTIAELREVVREIETELRVLGQIPR